MTDRFDYFVVLAEMRTGSNFLETNLNAFRGITCFGEAFNPHFIGYPNRTEILGVSQAKRDADPSHLIALIRREPGIIGGFRFFHDHDPRALDMCLDDPRCAKIILTRNPVDSYVSWKIARATGQWKLTDARRRKDAKAHFDAEEFTTHLDALQQFQLTLLNRLQRTGQTAFYVGYDDLHDLEVMNGLARFLGVEEQLEALDKSLKPQNPSAVETKVDNVETMKAALAALDRFDLGRTPNFEPRRGPVVPSYVAGHSTPLLYLPVRGGPEVQVRDWLAALDGVAVDDLPAKMNQKQLRQWKRANPGHRSFTVLRHPVARAYEVFCRRIAQSGGGNYAKIRQTLRQRYKLPLPQTVPHQKYDAAAHRTAFLAFLDFLKSNLAEQTPIRVDAEWCSQVQSLSGFAEMALPDLVLREEELDDALPRLAAMLGADQVPDWPDPKEPELFALSDIYDAEVEAKVAQVYQRDYVAFGFGPWGHAA